MYDVVAIGELLVDFTCLSLDSDSYPTIAAHPGGAPANFLAALAKYGAATAFIGKVGEDIFGSLLLKTLSELGVETSGVVSDGSVFTTLAFVTIDGSGEREFSFARKPGADTRLTEGEVDRNLIDDCRVLHFGSLSLTDEPSRAAVYSTVRYAKACGKLISFDPNLRRPLWRDLNLARDQMLWGIGQADIVKISDEELRFLFDADPDEGARLLTESYGVRLVFVTCGAEGCRYATAGFSGSFGGVKGIEPIDTTGAGDIFGGSALCRFLKTGKTLETLTPAELYDIVRFACTAASISTTRPGGISSVPEYEEVLAALELS